MFLNITPRIIRQNNTAKVRYIQSKNVLKQRHDNKDKSDVSYTKSSEAGKRKEKGKEKRYFGLVSGGTQAGSRMSLKRHGIKIHKTLSKYSHLK